MRRALLLLLSLAACHGAQDAPPPDAGTAPSCEDRGLVTCAGDCVDTRSDPSHCGACGRTCQGTVCRDADCATDCGALTDCGGACVDLSSSTAHCGRCDEACAADRVCADSACAAVTSLEWRPVYDPLDAGWLLSVWGNGSSDVWFVGGKEDALALHWDGDAFEEVAVPGAALLWWVWGTAAGDLWMVGEEGTILRRDGDAFTRVESPVAGATYYGIWGASADDLWIAGVDPDTLRGVLLRSEHAGPFAEVETPIEPVPGFFKVWGSAADDVWVVGERGAILHFDGLVWADEAVRAEVRLFTVHGCGTQDVWAVGGWGNGVVIHREDGVWVDRSPPYAPLINGVHCSEGTVRVVGMQGYCATLVGDEWEEALPTSLDVHGVWGAGPELAFGAGGDILSARDAAARRGALVHFGRQAPAGNGL